MNERLTAACGLLLLTAAVAAAQQFERIWVWVVPEGEEFGVLFPEINFRIRRELPFDEGRTLHPVSYEVTNRGVLFSVLSFTKSGPDAPQTLDAFVAGVGRALAANERGERASVAPARALKLEGRDGREFVVRVGESTGKARAYETADHFYLVMGVGHPSVAASVERFQESFTFNPTGPNRVPAAETVEAMKPLPTPAPLWPIAGGKTSYGVRDSAAAHGNVGASVPVSPGVLTGKVLKKVAPTYPPIAKAARAEGTVVVQITVDEEGYVIAASAVSGHPLLQQSAAHALRQWRFTPILLQGRPVKLTGTVSVNFDLK